MKHTCLVFKLVLIASVIIVSACDGGNAKSVSCSPGQVRGEYGNCTTPQTSCPDGQSLQNGSCKTTPQQCPIGQHIEKGQCVVDTLKCPPSQQEQNGRCVPIPLQCPEGQHEENGECVLDPVRCGSDQIAVEGECVDNVLSIQVNDLEACWNADGTTTMEVKFVVRDPTGKTIAPRFNSVNAPTELATELFVDTFPLDVEAEIKFYSDLLESDLAMSLVLDSTPSMLEHDPPAFVPMKSAAASILRRTKDLWEAQGSSFHWELSWFNSLIYRPLTNNADEPWTIDDVLSIPQPEDQSYTGLYKAVSYMAGVHRQLYLDGIAAGERDQHVMIIFTDGDDNYSYVDNSDSANEIEGNSENKLFWQGFGYQATRKEDLAAIISAVPNLKTFVIGFGDGVVGQNLVEIAQTGNGSYFYGENSTGLVKLFETVGKEIITEQTLQAKMPLQPATYLFTIESTHIDTGVNGQFNYNLTVGPGALPSCP